MKQDKDLKIANEVIKQIFDRVIDNTVSLDETLDGCKKSGKHPFGKDGICQGCGGHQSLLKKSKESL